MIYGLGIQKLMERVKMRKGTTTSETLQKAKYTGYSRKIQFKQRNNKKDLVRK